MKTIEPYPFTRTEIKRILDLNDIIVRNTAAARERALSKGSNPVDMNAKGGTVRRRQERRDNGSDFFCDRDLISAPGPMPGTANNQ